MKLLLFLLGSPAFAATLLKVACGGPGGAGWVPDAPYVTGGSTQAVAGAQPVPYSFLRYAPPSSSIQYSFSLSGVTTSVTLFFIEPRAAQAVGQRVFSVSLNGSTILTNLDLFAAAGALTPKSYTFPVTASAGFPLTIAFSAATGNAVVSGIQLDGAAPPPPGLTVACKPGTVLYSALTAGSSQDVVIVPGALSTYRFGHIYVRETQQFTGPLASLTVTMMAGAMELMPPLALKITGGLNSWIDRPGWPVGLPSYDIALRFTGSSALAGSLDGGALYWEVCGFDIAPAAATAACPVLTEPSYSLQTGERIGVGVGINEDGDRVPMSEWGGQSVVPPGPHYKCVNYYRRIAGGWVGASCCVPPLASPC